MQGQVSQSFQCAPYDIKYNWNTNSSAVTIYNSNITAINDYKGGPFQQAVSSMTLIDDSFYSGQSFSTFGYELWSDPKNRNDGYITWYSNNAKTWTTTAAATGPNSAAQIGQRLISEEPMVCALFIHFAALTSFS
jgi:beta-glucanase (GH16 family)